ncbi:Hypothetical_protein [Hexamita inflata]|uniref:Hypothetical_protein n=1 Tax=Hexamita inflata TaxID=28002 RepID=A0AA86QFL8_9EUKA|nr:Hypothetical protein HINF_LOCUS43496 [Hexamita inflata]
MVRSYLSEQEKSDIIRATHYVLQHRLNTAIPFTPEQIHRNYTQMNESLKNFFWNEVGKISGIEHQVAYKYFINTWTRQVFSDSVKENKETFVPEIISAFIKCDGEPNCSAHVWQLVKPIVEQNNWHLGQSYSLTHHHTKRLEMTNLVVNLKAYILDADINSKRKKHDRKIDLHLREIDSYAQQVRQIYYQKYDNVQEKDDSLINVLKDLVIQSHVPDSAQDLNKTLEEVILMMNKFE